MTAAPAPELVRAEDLRVGPLLAEGGEGRVFLLPRQPHLVYKAYRQPVSAAHLEAMVAWPGGLGADQAAVLRSAAAWPAAVVTGRGGRPVGLLVPRAPRRFAVRHRDGRSRLASLSYLTTDPGHRAAAYGLDLPPAGSALRVGLVYSLARLLATFESATPAVGHGDLSTKNVLWSLQRGPEVFVIDCDNAEFFDRDGRPAGEPGRRRAMTPNWDDPAVERGGNPTLASDRYSLALVFLRLVGAANFPVQARQRAGGPVRVDVPVPAGPGADALLDPTAPVWDLCARALSVDSPGSRPPAAEWVAELERLLPLMGAAPPVGAPVPAGSGPAPGQPAAGGPDRAGPATGDVEVVLARVLHRPERVWSKVSPAPRYTGTPAAAPGGAAPAGSAGRGAGGFAWRPVGPAPARPGGAAPSGFVAAPGSAAPAGSRVVNGPAVWPELKVAVQRVARWWWALHRGALRSLLRPRPRRRVGRALAACLLVDAVLVLAVVFLVAMIAAPLIGI